MFWRDVSTIDFVSLFWKRDVYGILTAAFGASFSIFVYPEKENHPDTIYGRQLKESVDKIFFGGFAIRVIFQKNKFLSDLAMKLFGIDTHVKRFLDKVKEMIRNRKKEIESGQDIQTRDIVSLMIKENLENKELSDEEIYSNAFIFFFVWTDTSSNTLQWFVYEVSKRPDIQKKIQEEVDRVLENGRKPTFQDFNSFIYLNSCINEALRVHPPVGSIFKKCIKSTHLGPIQIPKDSIIHSLIPSANKNEKIWTNANNFDP